MLLPSRTQAPRALSAVGILALAALTTPAALALAQLSLMQFVGAAAGAAALAIAVYLGRAKEIFLFFYVLSLAYNRQYYAFEWLDLGDRGFYWCPSDIFLALLFLIWVFEGARRIPHATETTGLAVWLAPMLLAASVSTFASSEPIGSLMEVLRWVKLAVLLVYLRHNLDERAARTVVVGFAAVVLLEAPLSVMQVAFGSGEEGLTSLTVHGTGELAHRASGTLGHPNFLAPYMLMVVPGFAAVAIGCRNRRMGLIAGVVALAGLITIVLTQSRAPILLTCAALGLIIALLTGMRVLPPVRAVGIGIFAMVAVTAAAIPFSDIIHSRLVGHFEEALDLRKDYDVAALEMWETRPFLGVGPNNFVRDVGRYAPKLKLLNDLLGEEIKTTKTNLRSIAPVHNLYLLILSELGLLGLLAFVIFLGRAVLLAWRASALAPRASGLFAAGVASGLTAQLAQQLVDFSLWWDPLLFSFALLMAVCARIEGSDAR